MAQRRVKAGLWEMLEAAQDEAQRIRSTQRVLVKGKMRDRPCPKQIRKAEVFEDIEKLIATIIPVQDEVRKVLIPSAKAIAEQKRLDRAADAAPIGSSS